MEDTKLSKNLVIENRTDIYRRCTLGQTLFQALEELVEEKKLTPVLANTVMDQFDRSVSLVLHDLPCTFEAVFQAGEIVSYSLVGDQWKIKLKDVLFNFVDQEVEDDISLVENCVIHCANPIPYKIDFEDRRRK